MTKHKALLLVASVTAFLTFFSGIIRHDVKTELHAALAREKQFECVGQLFKGDTAIGSCVLINERFVLTAGHCFIETMTHPDTIKMNGNTVIMMVPVETKHVDASRIHLIIAGQRVKVKRMITHPEYLGTQEHSSCDLALLELDHAIATVSLPVLNTVSDELRSDVIGVGFGASGVGSEPEHVTDRSEKLAGENVIDSVGGQPYNGKGTLLLCDFDHPSKTDCNRMGSAKPRPLEYICAGGDSGGGLFRENKGQWELIGICAGAHLDIDRLMSTGYYGQIMQWTRVSAFTGWIEEVRAKG